MLTYVIGLAGSGKTTLCAKYAYKFLKKNKNVYCNVPILGTKILECDTDLNQVSMKNGIVLIDEAAVEFNSREFAKLSKNVNEFIRKHRHAFLDVYVFSQNYMGADKLFRDNCEQVILLRKSRIHGFSLMRTYLHDIIPPNGMNTEFADKYILLPLQTRLIRFGSFSNMFDSYELPDLPEKDWKIWESKSRYSTVAQQCKHSNWWNVFDHFFKSLRRWAEPFLSRPGTVGSSALVEQSEAQLKEGTGNNNEFVEQSEAQRTLSPSIA